MYLMTILIIAFNEISSLQNPILTASKLSGVGHQETTAEIIPHSAGASLALATSLKGASTIDF